MKKNFLKVWSILEEKNKKKVFIATFLLVISSFFDLLGIASVLPFFSLLSSPDLLNTNIYLIKLNSFLNLDSQNFIIFLGISSFIIITLNQSLRFISTQYNFRFLNNIYYEKTYKLFNYYLTRPYKFILNKNNEVLIQRCTNMVNAATGYISPILFIIGNLLTSAFVIGFLLFYEPIITISIFLLLALFYLLVFQKIKKSIFKLGEFSAKYISESGKIIGNSFGVFKQTRIIKNNSHFVSKYKKIAIDFRNSTNRVQAYQHLPSSLIEIFAYGILILITLMLYLRSENFNTIIPIMGVLAISLRRLIPAVQAIYNDIVQIKFYNPSYNKIIGDLTNSFEFYKKPDDEKLKIKEINFNKEISLEKVSYKHTGRKNKNKIEITASFKKGESIGICGKTGHGKTTLIDILTGLLEPSSGKIAIDNHEINKNNLASWQSKIGYAPQNGYILDDTLENNIYFGQSLNRNRNKLKKICSIVLLNDLIHKKLNNSFKTPIGENGTRLSGGEQQRLILARILIRNPKVLILDEATNALDTHTENKLIRNIKKNYKNITIIFVTHRLNTLKFCNKILLIKDGKTKFYGSANIFLKRYNLHSNLNFKKDENNN